jgi:hypothetical protein
MYRKILILFTAAFVITLGLPVFAETGPVTGELLLQGEVSQVLSIGITPDAGAKTLNLNVTETGKIVATITERSNKKGGYTISFTSANGGELKSVDPTNTDTVPYQISYGTFSAKPTLAASDAVISTGRATGTGITRNVTISYVIPADLIFADEYSDTLTFTIRTP